MRHDPLQASVGLDVVILGAGVSAMGAHWEMAVELLLSAKANQVEPWTSREGRPQVLWHLT